ncbi:hypothetical protein [Amycolatopsis sp. CA-128772]|nr:hypothetical protein [Amycolatopsis sp. CA-128772]
MNLFFGTFGGRTRGYAELWNGTWNVFRAGGYHNGRQILTGWY